MLYLSRAALDGEKDRLREVRRSARACVRAQVWFVHAVRGA